MIPHQCSNQIKLILMSIEKKIRKLKCWLLKTLSASGAGHYFFFIPFLRDRTTLILNSERLKLNEYATTIDGSRIVSS